MALPHDVGPQGATTRPETLPLLIGTLGLVGVFKVDFGTKENDGETISPAGRTTRDPSTPGRLMVRAETPRPGAARPSWRAGGRPDRVPPAAR